MNSWYVVALDPYFRMGNMMAFPPTHMEMSTSDYLATAGEATLAETGPSVMRDTDVPMGNVE